MDSEMPEMNGIEAASKIRELECTYNNNEATTKIIMVTIKNQDKELKDNIMNICDWFITKPITSENIKIAMQNLDLI